MIPEWMLLMDMSPEQREQYRIMGERIARIYAAAARVQDHR